jgi:predicted PhzF superfamily epimerase YddE/YHI9
LLQKEIIARGTAAFLLEEQIGPVPVRIEGGGRPLIWLRTPPISEGRYLDRAVCARALGLEPDDLLAVRPQLLSAGNPTVVVAAKDAAAVDLAWLDLAGMRDLRGPESEPFCVFLFAATPKGASSRMFGPEYGIPEDPRPGVRRGRSLYS